MVPFCGKVGGSSRYNRAKGEGSGVVVVVGNNSNKCFFYRYYKKTFGREKYISELPDTYVITLMKFRCSNHKLGIELGRRDRTPREERLCTRCHMNIMDDELHFVLECPSLIADRIALIPVRYRRNISAFNFCQLMSLQSTKKEMLNLVKFMKRSKLV